MPVLRNLTLMASSTGLRLIFGLLSFVVMARSLGPEQFGLVMLWLAAASLLALLPNYGLTPFVLREIGIAPGRAREVLAEVLSARLLLSAMVLIVALACLPMIDASARAIFVLLLIAQLADGLAELFNVGFRATHRFAAETRLASQVVLLQFAVIALAVWRWPTPLAAAAGFATSRAAALLLAWMAQRRDFAGLRPASVAAGWSRVCGTSAYALDFGLQSLLGQVDSVVLNYFVGPASVGIHQAGMRLFNGGAQAANVLANVFLPRTAEVSADAVAFRSETARMQWAFIGVGLGFGLLLCVLAEPIVALLYGRDYAPLVALLPWFGLLFFVRFFAASWGIVLTSAGEQGFRAMVNFFQWCVIALLSLWLVPRHGLAGWLACLVLGNALLALAYLLRGRRIVGGGWAQPAWSAAGLLAFLPFLGWLR